MNFQDNYKSSILCQHCGEWHYSRSAPQAQASMDAQRVVDACGRSREIAGEVQQAPAYVGMGVFRESD